MAEIGIKTNRDGKLSLDTTRFAALLKSDPGMVEAVLASKRSVADARLTVAAVTDDTEPGIYEIAKTASGWTIGGTAATLTGTRLVAASGSTQDGLTIIIPTAVQTLASVGYSTEVSYSAGMLERFTDMLGDLKDSQSSLSRLSSNSTQAVSKLDTEQQKLDERADQIKARYLKQFAAMDGLVGRGKSTQDSLTNFMTAWSNSLK
jgi:flagellar hook-associated protein 2